MSTDPDCMRLAFLLRGVDMVSSTELATEQIRTTCI